MYLAFRSPEILLAYLIFYIPYEDFSSLLVWYSSPIFCYEFSFEFM